MSIAQTTKKLKTPRKKETAKQKEARLRDSLAGTTMRLTTTTSYCRELEGQNERMRRRLLAFSKLYEQFSNAILVESTDPVPVTFFDRLQARVTPKAVISTYYKSACKKLAVKLRALLKEAYYDLNYGAENDAEKPHGALEKY